MTFTRRLEAVRAHSFAQVATYTPGSTFGPRKLNDYELVWILDGQGIWSTDQDGGSGHGSVLQARTLRPGNLVIARQGATDSYQWAATSQSRHAFVHFSLDDEGAGIGSTWPSMRSSLGQPALSGLCSYLIQLAAVGSDSARERSDQTLAVLVDFFVHGPLSSDDDRSSDVRLVDLLALVRTSWEGREMRPVSNVQLAAWSHMSIGHLSKLFRLNFGLGPASVLEAARLVRAAITLQRTDMTLRTVATLTGFANEYHFSRRFVNFYAIPPGKFRRDGADRDPLGPLREAALRGAVNLLLAGAPEFGRR